MLAYRTSKSSLLKQAVESIEKDNDAFGYLRNRYILESVEKCDSIIIAIMEYGESKIYILLSY